MSNSNLVDNLRIWNIKIDFSGAAPWPRTVLLQSNTEEKNKLKTTNEQQKMKHKNNALSEESGFYMTFQVKN